MPDLWNVALLSAPFTTLSYEAPLPFSTETLAQGVRVLIPLGRSLRLGLLLDRVDTAPKGCRLKSIHWPVDRMAVVDDLHRKMAFELAKRQMREPGEILASFLPQGLRDINIRFQIDQDEKTIRLAAKELTALSKDEQGRLAVLWTLGRMDVEQSHRPSRGRLVRLAVDPPWPIRPAAIRQRAILDHLWESGPKPHSLLLKDLGASAGTAVRELVHRGLLCWEEKPRPIQSLSPSECESVMPTPDQTQALSDILQCLNSRESETVLVHGVTGSGKTLVYLRAVEACLNQGRSAYVLVPELALAHQMWRSVLSCFSNRKTVLYHGYQSPTEREATYLATLRSDEPVLVVGTRSALFLNVPNPGLIVLDEEHDTSFKQEDRLVYQAKEMAYFMMQESKGLLIMGSATPDLKTYFATEHKIFSRLSLPKRAVSGSMPEVVIVDLLKTPPVDGPLAPETRIALERVIESGEQAMVMQNRRGFAPIMYCVDCGGVARCPSCEVGLTYHKSLEKLVCHYCGGQWSFPILCEKCGNSSFLPLGEGTEQIAEFMAKTFPEAQSLRMDRDSTRRTGRMEEILDDFAEGRAQVLVGTQMLSKGHDFPSVTLVVVPDGDLGLNLPDYRATERSFQMLVQVSGRAGRGDKPGKVYIQTRNPEHACWRFIRDADYAAFYRHEISRRQMFQYPPFVKLGLVRFNFPVEWKDGMALLNEAAKAFHAQGKVHGLKILGPAPAPLSRIRNRLRFHCLIKGDDWAKIRQVYGVVSRTIPRRSPLRYQLDLDPVSML